MASKQFEHLQESSAARLRFLIPPSCPLVVARVPAGGFHVYTVDEDTSLTGRYQVVAAFITGYVAAWRRTSRRHLPDPPATPAPPAERPDPPLVLPVDDERPEGD